MHINTQSPIRFATKNSMLFPHFSLPKTQLFLLLADYFISLSLNKVFLIFFFEQ